ncbi:MAG TPA: diaminopimelate decarboxylase [Bacteroidales bacterium]|nr:diaminopimelate decarboxylase [Bacteroidales bacterium]HPS17162.1 diaminopimelate decarboxylase [Bacteroidales bacterium]
MILNSENEYRLGSFPVSELCERYGLPLYVYDGDIMLTQLKKLRNAFQIERLKICYACKALSNINVLRLFMMAGTGLDTVSIQEVWAGLKAGFEPKDIIYTPNCVSMEEIKMAIDAGVRINIDNLSVLEQFGHEFPNVPVCLRINPHIMAGGNKKISVGHVDSKFGISIYQIPHAKRIIETTGLRVEGLHMHTGSDILDIEVFAQGVDIILDVAKKFEALDYIDLGSGFKVPYKPSDLYTEIELLGNMISEKFNAFCNEYGRNLELVFEPGKFLVSEAGYFFARVNVIKQTTSTVFAGIDTGFNHLIRPMFYNSYHDIINISNPIGKQRIYTVVGYICETDTFGWNRKINEIAEGDILAMRNAGAYCFSMASNYNSRFRPAEVLIFQGKEYLIRKRETMEDIYRNQVEIEF